MDILVIEIRLINAYAFTVLVSRESPFSEIHLDFHEITSSSTLTPKYIHQKILETLVVSAKEIDSFQKILKHKRSDIADTGMLTMGYGGSGHSAHGFACGRFVSSGRLSVEDQVGNSLNWQIVPSRYFRDTTTWYHIVIAIDTTQSTSSNRVKYYINGCLLYTSPSPRDS